MKRLMTAVLATTVLAVPVAAQQVGNPAPRAEAGLTRAELETRVRAGFARADADRDGYVTQAEARGVRAGARAERRRDRQDRREATFARLDNNRDGMISRTEFLERAARAERGDRRERRVERRAERRERLAERRAGRGMGLRLGGRMMARVDADRDGRVSLTEVLAVRVQAFERADADRDGRVTREERRAARQAVRAARG